MESQWRFEAGLLAPSVCWCRQVLLALTNAHCSRLFCFLVSCEVNSLDLILQVAMSAITGVDGVSLSLVTLGEACTCFAKCAVLSLLHTLAHILRRPPLPPCNS
jgi:hypothetical protein